MSRITLPDIRRTFRRKSAVFFHPESLLGILCSLKRIQDGQGGR
jgi:hypothetical protein